MIIDKNNKLAFFSDKYEEAKKRHEAMFDRLNRNYNQYVGSTEIDNVKETDIVKDATQVRNITYELIESQVTSYVPVPKISSKILSREHELNAKSIEQMLKNARNELPFERHNDIDERYTYIYGGSVWLIEWDNSIVTHNSVGDVKITVINPRDFIPQPNVYNINDMEYLFIKFDSSIEDIERKYNVTITDDEIPQLQKPDDVSDDDDIAEVIVCYYKDDNDNICQYIFSGDKELQDLDNYYSRKTRVCKKCGKKEGLCQCEKPKFETLDEEFETLEHDILLSNGGMIPAMSPMYKDDGTPITETMKAQVMDANGNPLFENISGVNVPMVTDQQVPKLEPTKLPYYTPKTFPVVIRKNVSEEKNIFGQSDCDAIRPQQQGINKIESRLMEKLIKAGIMAVVPEDFRGDLTNAILQGAFKEKPNARGNATYRTVDLTPDITKDIAQSDRLYDQAKRILGISDSFQGQHDASAQSGKAKQIQINQSAGRLDSKRQNKNATYADIDRVIFELYLAYADEPRPIAYKDSNGITQNCLFNRYDFLDQDDSHEYYYDDRYLFATDNAVDLEQNRQELWQSILNLFSAGAFGMPQDINTLITLWRNLEQAHYPHAHENIERLENQMQQQMMQLQAQQQQMQQELNNRKGYEDYLTKQIGGVANG